MAGAFNEATPSGDPHALLARAQELDTHVFVYYSALKVGGVLLCRKRFEEARKLGYRLQPLCCASCELSQLWEGVGSPKKGIQCRACRAEIELAPCTVANPLARASNW